MIFPPYLYWKYWHNFQKNSGSPHSCMKFSRTPLRDMNGLPCELATCEGCVRGAVAGRAHVPWPLRGSMGLPTLHPCTFHQPWTFLSLSLPWALMPSSSLTSLTPATICFYHRYTFDIAGYGISMQPMAMMDKRQERQAWGASRWWHINRSNKVDVVPSMKSYSAPTIRSHLSTSQKTPCKIA